MFSKVADYKTGKQNSVAFLYANDKHTREGNLETNTIHHGPRIWNEISWAWKMTQGLRALVVLDEELGLFPGHIQ